MLGEPASTGVARSMWSGFGGILAGADPLAGQGEGGFFGFGEGGRHQQQAGGQAEGERLGAQTAEAGHGRSIS
ncbi:hypothetical protein G039_0334150 [Pseudomonas aeruginosa VRFPA01]|nr:hypothetical protein G039_0334150 [Pseudomonas aeruginosa VRFPA01]